ncbi:hypothetical protein SAMN06272735_7866 [Streptomyces sp. TLI_55]|nr:hypothetical protein SAMN06272735_7866 [Streptomyces sp. TLI_55]
MNRLLTASDLTNQTPRDALRDMLGKPFGSADVVYVPTASLAEPGDHSWLRHRRQSGSVVNSSGRRTQ